MKNEIVLFTDGDINIEVQINPEQETVWLTQKQMGELFNVKQATLSEHINNIISSGELNEIKFSDIFKAIWKELNVNSDVLKPRVNGYVFCPEKVTLLLKLKKKAKKILK